MFAAKLAKLGARLGRRGTDFQDEMSWTGRHASVSILLS
jgi:hypothetical protein